MDLKTKAIEKIARQLKNLGCEYMIVRDGDKETALTNGKFTYHVKTARGESTRHVESFLSPLAPGESVLVPVEKYSAATIASCCSATAFRLFGKGNYITKRADDDSHVEVLCLDRDYLHPEFGELMDDEPEE